MQIFNIAINITSACNIMCDYCSAYIPYDKNEKGIMSDTVIQTIVECINTYLSDFDIIILLVGGEPLLHPYLDKIISLLYSIKKLVHIEICTNGSVLLENVIHNHNKLNYILSYHIDMLLDKNLMKFNDIYFKNIEFFNSQNIPYRIKILDKKENFSKIKTDFIKLVEKNTESHEIKYVKIRPTKEYHKNENIITNKNYKYWVYHNRTINITRAIKSDKNNRFNNNIYFSYMCDLENVQNYISLYNIREWTKLKDRYNNKIFCNKPICHCPMCTKID